MSLAALAEEKHLLMVGNLMAYLPIHAYRHSKPLDGLSLFAGMYSSGRSRTGRLISVVKSSCALGTRGRWVIGSTVLEGRN